MKPLRFCWAGAFLGCVVGLLSIHARAAFGAATAPSSQPFTQPLREGWSLQDASKIDEAGDRVSRGDFAARGWHAAVVPGTVLTSLVADGTYPDPLYGANNLQVPESLNKTAWWYRTVLPAAAQASRKHWLKFEGVNYTAEVWLNGFPVGEIRGAFTRGDFEITDLLRADRPNTLAVLVHPQPHPGVPHQKTQTAGTGGNGGLSAVDGPTFLCTLGWDWIPGIADRDTGLWQDVSLVSSGPVLVENPYVQSKLPLPRTDSADLTVQATLRNATDAAQTGTLHGTIGELHFAKPFQLAPRETKTIKFAPADAPALHVAKPKLWWPNGFGAQNLYSLHLDVEAGNQTSDESDTSFGIRQVTYEMPGNDNLTIVVNGVPVFAKGGDWGIDEALKRIPPERLDAMIHLHALANYTFIRNWVGQSTSEAFYDACDKYGILLWDEMFQPNPSDGPNPIDTQVYLANIKEKILRFRSHPSIALWCGRNEGDPPPEITRGIQALIDQYDPLRLFQASSTDGRGVHSGGPYYWRTPKNYYNIDCAFKTEQGSMSIPTLEAVEAMLPQHSWNVIDDVWAEHDFCAGAQRGDIYPHEIALRYGAFSGLADFVRKGQLANYEAYRAMYEGRFAKLFRPTTGLFTWMSSPAQPSFVWQLYSHDLEPNAALFGTMKACEPVHIQMNQTDWHMMVINNRPTTQPHLTATARIYNLDGSLKQTINQTLDAAGSAATDVGEIHFNADLSHVHFVRLDLKDGSGRSISDNFYWRGVDDSDLADLEKLSDAPVRVQAERAGTQLGVKLTNSGKSIALMTHLQLRDGQSDKRILPVFYSDNYITLLPDETRELTIDAPSLGKDQAVCLAVDGWNTALDPSSGNDSVRVVLNRPAIARGLPASTQPAESEYAIRINCGGNRTSPVVLGSAIEAPGTFEKDIYHLGNGGSTIEDNHPVTTEPRSRVPSLVYQSARSGPCAYELPVLSGRAYTIRLHFSESEVEAGARKFNVLINGETAISDLDIAAEAGLHHALVKTFHGIQPNRNGRILIGLRRGSAGEPLICGIEAVPESVEPTTAPTTARAAE